ncbi:MULTISPECIES: hypothetical protein [Neobacillus]|uniref:Uncharacterized protein n=1 Tax=Neobacillus rhizophilus TaxID=2833579 RepID=A0A942YTT5_9BACI|nr:MULTISPECIES: hypothetical protein [Neobacillus]MBS4213253.1 hypothetical protein [Neobacillus rhizophilus]
MEEHVSEKFSQMFEESLSHIESSFTHLLNSLSMLEEAAEEKDDFFIVLRDIKAIRDSILEFKKLADEKRKMLIVK